MLSEPIVMAIVAYLIWFWWMFWRGDDDGWL